LSKWPARILDIGIKTVDLLRPTLLGTLETSARWRIPDRRTVQ
jgi:hypothetical protein